MRRWWTQLKHAVLYAMGKQRIKQVAPGKYKIRIHVKRLKKG